MANSPLSPLGGFVRLHDPDRFLAALFVPAARREAAFALVALNHELARAREATTAPISALIRLQWWRDAIEEAAAGRPARRHEVAEPLHAAITGGALAADDLSALVDAREAETEESIPTRESFGAYLRGTGGGLALALGHLLGVPDSALPLLQRLGALQALAGVLRNVPAHAAQGRCLLPADALAEAGLAAEAVIADARVAEPLRRALAEEGLATLLKARAEALPREAVPAVLPVVLATRDLRRLAAGRPIAATRGAGDRLALIWSGYRGRL